MQTHAANVGNTLEAKRKERDNLKFEENAIRSKISELVGVRHYDELSITDVCDPFVNATLI